MTEAVFEAGEILCAKHRKRIARITEKGIELWCKAEGGHAVLLSWEKIAEVRERQR